MRSPIYVPHKFLIFLFLFLICRSTTAADSDSTLWTNSSSESSLLLFQSKEGDSSGGAVVPAELWCVAKNNAEDGTLQSALDWACGPGGSDCQPIQQGGACFDFNDIQFHASYAFNDYYLRHGLDQQACDFGGAAALTSIDPAKAKGIANCRFPSSLSVRNGSLGVSTGGGGSGGSDASGARVVELSWTQPFMVLPLLMVVITTATCSSASFTTWLS